MGLLDSLFSGSQSGGGLLDFLRANALNQQMPSGLPSDQAQYGAVPNAIAQAPIMPQQNAQPSPLDSAQWPAGPNGTPSQANAQIPQQPPPIIQAQQPQFQQQPSGGLAAGLSGFISNLHTGPLGAIAGGLASAAGLQDPATKLKQQTQNLTLQALIQKGVDPTTAQAAIGNPELLKALVTQNFGPQTVTPLGEGHIYNPRTGKVEQAYEPADKNKIVKSGQDGVGREQYGIFNPSDGTVKPYAPAAAANTSEAMGDQNLTGKDYLATLPKQQAGTIQMMVEGKMPPPTSFAMSKPYWQRMIAAARQYDPSFDETTWAARNNMQKSAQGDGKIGQNNNKLNTGIGHLTQLSDAVEGLGNSSYSQTYNAVKNMIGTELGGTGQTNFASIVNRVAPEIVGIWRNAGGAEADIKRDIDSLKDSHTPEQLHGAIANIAGLMRSKIESNNYEYKATMGKEPAQPFIRPDAEAALKVLEGRAGRLINLPSSASSSQIQEGATATNPQTGQKITFRNGKWQ